MNLLIDLAVTAAILHNDLGDANTDGTDISTTTTVTSTTSAASATTTTAAASPSSATTATPSVVVDVFFFSCSFFFFFVRICYWIHCRILRRRWWDNFALNKQISRTSFCEKNATQQIWISSPKEFE